MSSAVPAGLDLPQEVRLEFDVGQRARISLVAAGTFVVGESRRRQGRLLFDETRFGAYARIGKLFVEHEFILSSGTYFGFERREIMGSPYLGMVFGTQIGSSMKN